MSTGTPLLTTKLPGIPQDQYPYVYLMDDGSINAIYKGLKNVIDKPRIEIHSFGLAAKAFVLREKNNITQAKKIITILKMNL